MLMNQRMMNGQRLLTKVLLSQKQQLPLVNHQVLLSRCCYATSAASNMGNRGIQPPPGGSSTATGGNRNPFGETKVVDRLRTALPSEPMLDPDDSANAEEVYNEDAIENTVTFKDVSVEDIMEHKIMGREVRVIDENSTVYDAIKLMSESRIGALVVTNSEGKPVGVISERDYLNKIILKGMSSKKTLVNQIMTPQKDLITINLSDTAGHCMHLMTHHRVRHLPVVNDEGKLAGLVSIGDIVKYILVAQKQTIAYLKDYIERTY